MTTKLMVIRIRGSVNVNRDIAFTLDQLKLRRVNNAVIVDDRPSYRGMLQKIKDYVTWGEIDKDDLTVILKHRGDIQGNKKLTEDYIKTKTEFKSIDDFSNAFIDSKAKFSDIPGLKPIFRMHPPRKGHKGIKKAFPVGGSLGNRGPKIKELIYKMR